MNKNFWNDTGVNKIFCDPFAIERLALFVNKNSKIIEYGCGYGRVMNILFSHGYTNLIGFDVAPHMIKKAQESFPIIDFRLFETANTIPLADHSVDAVILSTVLCCNPERCDQERIFQEIKRVLAKNGILYFCDFLVTQTEYYLAKYGDKNNIDYGVYQSSDGILVRHYTLSRIMELLEGLELQWLEQINGLTMNNHDVRMIHLIAQKN